jgi:hypothetical protein
MALAFKAILRLLLLALPRAAAAVKAVDAHSAQQAVAGGLRLSPIDAARSATGPTSQCHAGGLPLTRSSS